MGDPPRNLGRKAQPQTAQSGLSVADLIPAMERSELEIRMQTVVQVSPPGCYSSPCKSYVDLQRNCSKPLQIAKATCDPNLIA